LIFLALLAVKQTGGKQLSTPHSKKGRMANHPTLLRVGEKEKT